MHDTTNQPPTDQRLDEALAAYYQAAEAGEPLDRDAFMARHQTWRRN